MIYFFYGPDSYRLSQKLKEIKRRYQKAHGGPMNLVELEGSEISFPHFQDICHQPSMFVERRLVVIKNLFQAPEKFCCQLQSVVEKLDQSATLFVFYHLGKIKKKDPLFQKLKKQVKSEEFSSLGLSETTAWLDKEAESYGLVLQSGARTRLASLIKGDLWLGQLALKKIAAYLGEGGKEVSAEEVEKLMDFSSSINVFQVVNALQENKLSEALTMVNHYLDQGGPPEFLIGQFNALLVHLLYVRSLLDEGKNAWQIRAEVPFNSKAVYYLINPAQRFSAGNLKKKIQDLFQADLGIKTGRQLPRPALNDFLLKFSRTD